MEAPPGVRRASHGPLDVWPHLPDCTPGPRGRAGPAPSSTCSRTRAPRSSRSSSGSARWRTSSRVATDFPGVLRSEGAAGLRSLMLSVWMRQGDRGLDVGRVLVRTHLLACWPVLLWLAIGRLGSRMAYGGVFWTGQDRGDALALEPDPPRHRDQRRRSRRGKVSSRRGLGLGLRRPTRPRARQRRTSMRTW